jgi:hypothetical protein
MAWPLQQAVHVAYEILTYTVLACCYCPFVYFCFDVLERTGCITGVEVAEKRKISTRFENVVANKCTTIAMGD